MQAWNSLKMVISNVLGDKRSSTAEMKSFVQKMMMISHYIDDFIKQSPSETDEHGEHFHQVTMPMESRYKGKRLDSMLAEVCWWSETTAVARTKSQGELRVS